MSNLARQCKLQWQSLESFVVGAPKTDTTSKRWDLSQNSREDQTDGLAFCYCLSLVESYQTCEPGRTGGVDVDIRMLARQPVCFDNQFFIYREWISPRHQHTLEKLKPIVGFVVEDTVGQAMGLVFPRPHELIAVVGSVFEFGIQAAR